jgi:hypothetical protein
MTNLHEVLKNINNNSHYLKYAKNIYTQNGDDGIIEQLFKDLNITSGTVVEFGAWDGIYISNVFNLWANKNYSAILIESDENRAGELQNLCAKFDNVEVLCTLVSDNLNSENCLDRILSKSKFNVDKDNLAFVSIDVDSIDYDIFKSITKHFPKIVAIEYDSGIPADQSVYSYSGSVSSKALSELAAIKGYTPVCATGNLYVVRNDLVHMLPKVSYDLHNIHASTELVDILQKTDELQNVGDSIRYRRESYLNFIQQEKENLMNA